AAYPTRTQEVPWSAICLTTVLPSALFFLAGINNPVPADWWPVMLNASSFTEHAALRLDSYAEELRASERRLPYFLLQTKRGVYSAYSSGMVTFALPAALGARLLGSEPADFYCHRRLDRMAAAGLSAACLGLFFAIALHIVPPAPAWIPTLFLA